MPSIFPDGLDYVYNHTGWAIVGHNRYWSDNNVYAKQNGGQYDFIIDKDTQTALPTDQKFWDFLMHSSRQWGLRVYEQDWLFTEVQRVAALTQDPTIGRMWLRQMGTAAQRNGLNIQYCMSWPRHILQSVEIPAVTQARASGDYHAGLTTQWNIGITSMLADAVGIMPTKDNYWSTADQPGNPYHDGRTEPYSRLQSAVSSLSRGPVAPSDAVGKSNRTLIMRACMDDGTLLRPDRPASEIDGYYLQQAFGSNGPSGHLWTTESSISERFRTFHALGVNLSTGFTFKPSHTAMNRVEAGATWVAFNDAANGVSNLQLFSEDSPIKFQACHMDDFQLYHISPVDPNSGIALLGEISKWVPVSADRFFEGKTSSSSLDVRLRGMAGERVTVSYVDMTSTRINSDGSVGAMTIQSATCTIAAGGSVSVSLPSGRCYDWSA